MIVYCVDDAESNLYLEYCKTALTAGGNNDKEDVITDLTSTYGVAAYPAHRQHREVPRAVGYKGKS